jgi:hypothetical protein
MVASGNVTAYSDERLKENIAPLQNAKEIVLSLQGVSYTMKATGEESIGFVAQRFREHLPKLVKVDGNGFLSLDYSKTTAVLVEAFKTQDAEIEQMKAQLASLQQTVNLLLSK